jgi:PAS domain S-box-containing protein
MPKQLKRYVGLAIGIAIVALIGVLAVFLVRSSVEQEIRAELIRTVDVAVAAVDARLFHDLSYSDADMTNQGFLSLQKQIVRLGKAFKVRGIRWLYVVKIVDGETRIAMDSIPLDDPEYSPPGIIYEQPPAAISDVLRDGQTRFVGPYTDEYGSFYSVFTPVLDPTDRSTIALMAADVDTANFAAAVSERQRLPLLVTVLGAILFAVIYLYAAERLEERRLRLEREKDRLRNAKEREALLLHIQEGIVACGLDGKVIFVNPFAAELLGLTAAECIGRLYRENWLVRDASGRVLPDDRQPIPLAFADGATRSYPLTAHFHLGGRDGENLPVTVSVAPVDLGGQVSAVVLAIRDVRQEAEIDRMKTEFISIASHQLRSPIGGLKSATAMLLDGSYGELAPRVQETLGAMDDVIERMAETVNVLLDVSRIESGKLVVVPEPTDIGSLAADTIKENEYAAKAKKQEVNLDVQSDLPQISADPKLVREIYKNLLTNAIKYTPEAGRIDICVRTDGPEALSVVKDNGYGIPEKDRARVFQKFYRGENIVGLKEVGTGLGLYCVKMLVEASGGRMWFESAENKGTTFFFTLPLTSVSKKDSAKGV